LLPFVIPGKKIGVKGSFSFTFFFFRGEGGITKTLISVSGTTGVPKGVVLTQANSVAAIYGISAVGEKGTFAVITKEDVYISYLPLAHVFERAAQGIHLYNGAALGYYQVRTFLRMCVCV
jgi:long-subunit acyl-CoA synthetase (AMP-forming)